MDWIGKPSQNKQCLNCWDIYQKIIKCVQLYHTFQNILIVFFKVWTMSQIKQFFRRRPSLSLYYNTIE